MNEVYVVLFEVIEHSLHLADHLLQFFVVEAVLVLEAVVPSKESTGVELVVGQPLVLQVSHLEALLSGGKHRVSGALLIGKGGVTAVSAPPWSVVAIRIVVDVHHLQLQERRLIPLLAARHVEFLLQCRYWRFAGRLLTAVAPAIAVI